MMESLNAKLEQLAEKQVKNLPKEFVATGAKAVKELVDSEFIQGLSVGEAAPKFILPDATGVNVSLSEILEQGPVVLSFYRGSW
jgi:hypothetical protein